MQMCNCLCQRRLRCSLEIFHVVVVALVARRRRRRRRCRRVPLDKRHGNCRAAAAMCKTGEGEEKLLSPQALISAKRCTYHV